MKKLAGFIGVAVWVFGVAAAPRLVEVRTATNSVFDVVFRSSIGNVDEVELAPAGWSINGEAPKAISRYVMAADKSDHHIYLKTDALVAGTSYVIHTPYADTTIVFNDREMLCASIKTNQVAYSALAKNSYALFAIWLGDAGGEQIKGELPVYEVFEQKTGTVVAQGALVKIGASASSADTVYKIDLSKVPEGGPYKIAVQGYGVSYPFGIGGDFSRRLSYTMFRGFYYQRCGCPIVAPYGLDIREKPCHTTVYKVNGPVGEANITVGSEPSFTCVGGYHDAGDADRRAYHMANPIINLMVYEAFPDLFTDGQFNIPDKFNADFTIAGKGNGIPDIIDEAVWGTMLWEYLQNDDGSIQWGTETKGYPEPFEAPLDNDDKKYGTVKVDDRAAAVGAGLFMHLARVLKPYDAAHAEKLAARGEKAYAYIGTRIKNPEKLYYNIQKYLYDGDEAAHAAVKELKTTVDTYKANTFRCNGYQLNDDKFDNPGYIYSYIAEKKAAVDPALVDYFKNSIKDAADVNLAELAKYVYPVANNPEGTSWGHNVMQPLYACAPLLYWGLTKDQKYVDGAAEMMNYALGLNPLGISYIIGLGFHQVHNPHDREFAFAKVRGIGVKPGITVFGAGVIQNFSGASGELRTWPEIGKLPFERMFGDNVNSISTNEYTIFETMSHYALYTVLSGGGTWSEENDPFSTGTAVVSAPAALPAQTQVTLHGVCNGQTLTLSLGMPRTADVTGELFAVDGRKIADFAAGTVQEGRRTVTIPVAMQLDRKISDAVVICRINVGNGEHVAGKVNWSSR